MDAEISIRSEGRMLRFDESVVHEGTARATRETATPFWLERVRQLAGRIALSLSRRVCVVVSIGPAVQARS
jgi:hypothetical protein